MQTNSSARSKGFWPVGSGALWALLTVTGCVTESVPPVFVPVPTHRVRGTGSCRAGVMLTRECQASVQLYYKYRSGRVWFTRVGLINHDPAKATVLFRQAQVYVDDGPALEVMDCKDFAPAANPGDFDMLKGYPGSARGTWLVPKRRVLRCGRVRGPIVVLPYSVDGHAGFVKIRYRNLSDIAAQ